MPHQNVMVEADIMETGSERRQYRRVQLADHNVTLVHADDAFAISVEDICLGGVAFSYYGDHVWPDTELELDFMDGDFRLEKVGAKVVWDREDRGRGVINGKVRARRCGVKFTRMAKEQEKLLRGHIARVLAEME